MVAQAKRLLINLGFKGDINKTCIDLYIRKNKDYGDSFSQTYKLFGDTMVKIRLYDKWQRYKRLKNNKAEVKDESIYDTMLDFINYSIMGEIESREGEDEE